MTDTTARPTEDDILLLHAYIDGELDPAGSLDMERRLAANPALSAERARIDALRHMLRTELPRETASPALLARIRAAVAAQNKTGRMRSWSGPTWRALAASVVLSFAVGAASSWVAIQSPSSDGTGDAVLAGHIRGLMAAQAVDVVSSDRHTVKPWFAGRIPEAPRVVDLADAGFPLTGGRIDVIGRSPAATVVYKRRLHVISVTAVPSSSRFDVPVSLERVSGYNRLSWTNSGVAYWAISDLNDQELRQFADLFRTAQ